MNDNPMPPKVPEVLAPAGGPESLQAAVRAGADAVYLGASAFSARANAKNFDGQALKEAVFYCHARGVKVYLALNTLLQENELLPALELLQYACTLPVDAVLVQDMGLFLLAKRCAPGMPIHASTQMSLHTPAGVRAAYASGMARVVLSREMSLREIAEVHTACPVELEAFVHGALCMSVSGQCYFSSMLGARSGNRGLCAQPCRLPFSTPGGTGHDLSLKDLSMIERMGDLAQAGVVSAKIEGRMKRPEYVAAAVRACRLSADGHALPPDLMRNLGAVFSRSGFTTGYLDGHLGREMFGTRTKEDVTGATEAVFSDLRNLYRQEMQRVPVAFSLKVHAGEPVCLTARDHDGHETFAQGPVPEPALRRPVTAERCTDQLQKTGGTPFGVEKISCDLEDGLSIPVSLLNRLRREVLEKLEWLRAVREPVAFSMKPFSPMPHRVYLPGGKLPLRARFSGIDLPEAAKECERVYLPYTAAPEKLAALRKEGVRVALELPRGMFGMEEAVRTRLQAAKEAGITHVWAGNLGAAALAKELGMTVHGGFSLNVTNSAALEWYSDFGLTDTELSFELALSAAAQLGGTLPRGWVLYGRLPLMLTRNCPAANSEKGCLHCTTAPELTDRKGVRFPVQCYGACSEVLNSVPLWMADRLNEVKHVDFGVLRFTTETKEEQQRVLEAYLHGKGVSPPSGTFTRGLYYKGWVMS